MVFSLVVFAFTACKKDSSTTTVIDEDIARKIQSLGFSIQGVQKTDEGFLVENDILLTAADLDRNPQNFFLRIANDEQYRTFDIVIGLPRTITVSLAPNLPGVYGPALDLAIKRFNDENLQLHFQRTSGTADITVTKGSGNYFAVSGFPSVNGKPFSQVKINPMYVGRGNSSETFKNYLATIIAHEIGHCIGFRHTDYMNRNFSCGGKNVNEGAGTAGAILIPGTPSTPDQGSWMIACIASGENRPFNNNDRIALNYLY